MHVGLDAHKKRTVGFVVHGDGKREGPFTMTTTKEALQLLSRKLAGGTVYVEASTSGKGVVRYLRELGVNAVLVHPDSLMLTLRKRKTDEEDALHLALVGQVGAAHAAYVPTQYEDDLRTLTRRRYDVTQRAIALKCQAHAVLARNLVPIPPGKLSRESTRRRWEQQPLPPRDKTILRGILREIAFLHEELDDIWLQTQEATKGDPLVARLLTIPGMNVLNAATIRGEYGDMTRFPSAKQAASYAGIVPPTWKSGEKELHGRISRKGSPYLRSALIETIHHARLRPSDLNKTFRRLAPRIGNKKALVALARRLSGIVWAMLTKDRDYKDADADLTHRKQWRHGAINHLLETGRRDLARKLMHLTTFPRDLDLWKRRVYGDG